MITDGSLKARQWLHGSTCLLPVGVMLNKLGTYEFKARDLYAKCRNMTKDANASISSYAETICDLPASMRTLIRRQCLFPASFQKQLIHQGHVRYRLFIMH